MTQTSSTSNAPVVRGGRWWRHLRIGALIGSCWLALVAAAVPADASADRISRSCPDVMFIGARGSGEPADRATHGMGRSVDYMANRLDAALVANGLTMSKLPVIYPAAGVEVLIPSKAEIALLASGHPIEAAALYYDHEFKRYIASINEGISQAMKEANVVATGCPDTMLVMAGYSQGAMVIHQAERRLDGQRDAAAHDAVIGTLLLGDGDRIHESRASLFGSAPVGGEGVRVYLHGIQPHDVDEPWSTAEICNSQDIVCDFNLEHVRSLQRARSASGVHTRYLAHDPAVLNQAVDWLAARATGTIGPSGLLGRLRFDTASGSDVIAAMGAPAAVGAGNVDTGFPDYQALGYGCAPGTGATTDPVLWNCQTTFYINQNTNRLAAVSTKSRRLIGPGGIYVGESAAQAERRVHVQAFSGCGQGFNLGSRRNRADMLIPVAGGTSHNAVLYGGRITEFELESNAHPVGLLFC